MVFPLVAPSVCPAQRGPVGDEYCRLEVEELDVDDTDELEFESVVVVDVALDAEVEEKTEENSEVPELENAEETSEDVDVGGEVDEDEDGEDANVDDEVEVVS